MSGDSIKRIQTVQKGLKFGTEVLFMCVEYKSKVSFLDPSKKGGVILT